MSRTLSIHYTIEVELPDELPEHRTHVYVDATTELITQALPGATDISIDDWSVRK
jgi:hypothetical protein